MGGVKQPTFKINPNFRLTTRHLSVRWHKVDLGTLQCEAAISMPDRFTLATEIIVEFHGSMIDIIYHSATDFESSKTQRWLRELFRDLILRVARQVLPARVRYLENLKGLHGSGVTVKRLPKNVLGYCTSTNHIALQPFLVIFKQEWMDGVILHEMAHYRHKHHYKAFWDFLSTLLGKDSRQANAKNDIAISPFYDYYLYLTRTK